MAGFGDLSAFTNGVKANPVTVGPAVSSNPDSVGNRTGIAAYNGITIPKYNDPYDVSGFKDSKYYQLATGDSESPWSKLAVQQQGNLADQQNSAAKGEAQGAAAASASRLAMQGGLTSGARERSQEQAGKNVLSMTQGNNQTASNNIANIGIDDAKQRTQMLGDATTKLNAMQSGNITGQNDYNQNLTSMLNQAVGANQTSQATIKAADAQGGGLSAVILASSILLGSGMSIKEAHAADMLSKTTDTTSEFSRVVNAARASRDAIASKKEVLGYYHFSRMLLPVMERSDLAKRVVFVAMVKPIASQGVGAKLWARFFGVFWKIKKFTREIA